MLEENRRKYRGKDHSVELSRFFLRYFPLFCCSQLGTKSAELTLRVQMQGRRVQNRGLPYEAASSCHPGKVVSEREKGTGIRARSERRIRPVCHVDSEDLREAFSIRRCHREKLTSVAFHATHRDRIRPQERSVVIGGGDVR